MFKKDDLIICKPAEEERNERNKEFETYARVVKVDGDKLYLDEYMKMGALHTNHGRDTVEISVKDAEKYYQPMNDAEKELFARTLTGRRLSADKTRIHLGGNRLYEGWEKISETIRGTLSVCEGILKGRTACDLFLGGTCADSTWRDELIPTLSCSYFNPVVEVWTDECYENELWHMEHDENLLWVITPETKGFLSFAEAVDNAYKYGDKLIFTFIPECNGKSFDEAQLKSLQKIGGLVEKAGGRYFEDYEQAFGLFAKERKSPDIVEDFDERDL